MKSRIVLFIFCMLIWLGLNWPVDGCWFWTGVIASMSAAMVSGNIFVHRPHIAAHAKRYVWIGYYLLVFVVEVIKANFDIVYRVSLISLPLSPGILKIRTKIKSEIGLALLANSITFSPGASTVDIDADRGYIYVHCLDVQSQNIKAATEIIAGKFEKILKMIFE
ncbi:MAG: Na+/H+ antiporter subunit E [Candidatus Omnitrophica bacterium]|nr:Na+/H+ antiporter subunit E [Candidatus Omnitrophota bacterium]